LSAPDLRNPLDHARRFLASQAVMLGLQGIPGVYFHSLVGTPNDQAAAEASGQARKINRHKYFLTELEDALRTSPLQRAVFQGYCHLLRQRIGHAAFHPDAEQETLDMLDPRLLVFRRMTKDRHEQIIVATNFGTEPVDVDLAELPSPHPRRDLISQERVRGHRWTIPPSTTVWLSNEGGDHA
jgi:sucrose phosphorylase